MRYVFLDPDGTLPSWVGVITCGPTGVTYVQQCGGTTTDTLEAEGYLVPVGGLKFDHAAGETVSADALRKCFHRGKRCYGDIRANPLSDNQVEVLSKLVAEIAWWCSRKTGEADSRHHLVLDTSRLVELTEAWVPVTMPDGRGYLVWKNCD